MKSKKDNTPTDFVPTQNYRDKQITVINGTDIIFSFKKFNGFDNEEMELLNSWLTKLSKTESKSKIFQRFWNDVKFEIDDRKVAREMAENRYKEANEATKAHIREHLEETISKLYENKTYDSIEEYNEEKAAKKKAVDDLHFYAKQGKEVPKEVIQELWKH